VIFLHVTPTTRGDRESRSAPWRTKENNFSELRGSVHFGWISRQPGLSKAAFSTFQNAPNPGEAASSAPTNLPRDCGRYDSHIARCVGPTRAASVAPAHHAASSGKEKATSGFKKLVTRGFPVF
jgi:hypothetical protein